MLHTATTSAACLAHRTAVCEMSKIRDARARAIVVAADLIEFSARALALSC